MITINSKKYKGSDKAVLKELLEETGMLIPGIIVVVDERLIPRSEYENFRINASQKIEITHVVGGG